MECTKSRKTRLVVVPVRDDGTWAKTAGKEVKVLRYLESGNEKVKRIDGEREVRLEASSQASEGVIHAATIS